MDSYKKIMLALLGPHVKWIIAIIAIVIAINTVIITAYALDMGYNYTINQSELPFYDILIINISYKANASLNITKQCVPDCNFIEAPDRLYFITNMSVLQVNISIPENTSIGNYTGLINLSNESSTVIRINIGFTVINESLNSSNNNSNNLSDNDGDGYTSDIDCNDSDPNINPGMDEIYYNNKDDDCNPNTTDDYPVTLTTNTVIADLGQSIEITANAPESVAVIEVWGPSQQEGWTELYEEYYYNGTLPDSYPWIVSFNKTFRIGEYNAKLIINYSWPNGTIIQKTAEAFFNINNNIDIDINYDPEIQIGEEETLTATATGGINPLNVKWLLHNNTVVWGQDITIGFTSPGEYKETAIIVDDYNNTANKSVVITAYTTYQLSVIVTDEAGNALEDSIVDINNYGSRVTDSTGKAVFELKKGRYSITASKQGFKTMYLIDYLVDKDSSITMALTRIDTQKPKITLLSPENNAKLESVSSIELRFKLEDDGINNCDVLFGNAKNIGNNSQSSNLGLKVISTLNSITSGEYSVKREGLEQGVYYWKVSCVDTENHKGDSIVQSFEITNPTQIVEVSSISESINNALDNLQYLNGDESIAAKALGLKESLNNALKELGWAERDLNDLAFRRDLTDEEKTRLRQSALSKISNIRQNTIESLEVSKSERFVVYPRNNDFSIITTTINKALKKDVSEKSLEAVSERIITTTTAMLVTIKFLDDKTINALLIIKELKYNSTTPELSKQLNPFIIEFIPKNVSKTTSNIVVLNKEFDILEDDPVLKFELTNKIVYYIKNISKDFGVDDAKLIKTLAYSNIIPNKATGLYIGIDGIKTFFRSKYLTILLVIIALGLFIYILTSLGFLEPLQELIVSKQLRRLNKLLDEAFNSVEDNDLETAVMNLKEARFRYETSSEDVRTIVYTRFSKLLQKINSLYMKALIEDTSNALGNQQLELAEVTIKKIAKAYDVLDDNEKQYYWNNIKSLIQRFQELNSESRGIK